MSCICLGPKGSGKTHLLKALQDENSIDETSYSTSTIGTSIYNILLPLATCDNWNGTKTPHDNSLNKSEVVEMKGGKLNKTVKLLNFISILEIGGNMAPIWRQYYDNVNKLIYVVDTSNLCQISAAGVLFYSILTEPRLQKTRILLVLTKMDYAYRQMRNEALLMLQMSKLQKEIRQVITIVEASAITKIGFPEIYEWLRIP